MPAKLVDDPLVLFELVVFVTMSRLQKIDQRSLAVRFVYIDGTIQKEVLGFLRLEKITGDEYRIKRLDLRTTFEVFLL